MPTAALFTTAKTWRQPKCLLMGECTKKIKWDTHTHTQEYYLAMKRNEIPPFISTWIDFHGTILNEISQTKKDKYYMI